LISRLEKVYDSASVKQPDFSSQNHFLLTIDQIALIEPLFISTQKKDWSIYKIHWSTRRLFEAFYLFLALNKSTSCI